MYILNWVLGHDLGSGLQVLIILPDTKYGKAAYAVDYRGLVFGFRPVEDTDRHGLGSTD